eukprot:359971-Chlamydomonas_euryale.AAC.10
MVSEPTLVPDATAPPGAVCKCLPQWWRHGVEVRFYGRLYHCPAVPPEGLADLAPRTGQSIRRSGAILPTP